MSCGLRVSVELNLEDNGLVRLNGRWMTLLPEVIVGLERKFMGVMVTSGAGEGIYSSMVLMWKSRLRRGHAVRAWIGEQVEQVKLNRFIKLLVLLLR